MRRLIVAAFAALSLAAVAAAAAPSVARADEAAWEIDPAHSAAQFAVKHMMVSTVRGEFGHVTGTAKFDPKDLSKTVVEATIDATSINTRVEKRDAHLKSQDFFDVAKYPTITFRSKKAEPKGDGKLDLVGDLTIHGVTQQVVLHVEGPSEAMKDPWGNTRVGAMATTKVNRQDFGLKWNAALETGGVMVGDEVTITIDVELVKKK